MPEKRVTVLARARSKPGAEERLKAELLSLVEPSRRDHGCINYDLHQSADDPALFMFHENWESRAALEAHLDTPHLEAFDERTKELLAEPVEITLWELIV
ncbi:MAG TPA: putative quinol monooxygenase [Pyrinomonadaceae bacterium]|jgi:quinol monooxygenase YgiN|nr:putative quinol monooxygenase [Pyrinomonadaceae bacterium]